MNISGRKYGNVLLLKGICLYCMEETIIASDGMSICCNYKVDRSKYFKGRIVQEVPAYFKRKKPSKKKQKQLIKTQKNKCYWCNIQFGSFAISKKGKIYKLKPVWDHYIPYSYTGSCDDNQFVASCRICNSFKSAKIIRNEIDENIIRKIIIKKWESKGWIVAT